MRTLAAVAMLVAAFPAVAKPWQGIEPGVSKRDEIVQKFGTPSRLVNQADKEIIAYFGKEAIKGTTQAQFKVDSATKLVERIDVFPGPVIDKETIENSYGTACSNGQTPTNANANPCYIKKMTDEFRTYFLYQKLGLAIFFNEDGKSVHSFIFTTLKAAK